MKKENEEYLLRTKELVNKIEALRENMKDREKNAEAERKRHEQKLEALRLEVQEERKATQREQDGIKQLKRKIMSLEDERTKLMKN